MKIKAFIKIPTEKISNLKTNIVKFKLEPGGKDVGEVVKVINETQHKDIYHCEIYIYPDKEFEVIRAMDKEKQGLVKKNGIR